MIMIGTHSGFLPANDTAVSTLELHVEVGSDVRRR